MHANGIKVLDAANHNGVVVIVAHQLKLVFFPTHNRLLEKDFGGWRGLQSSAGNPAQVCLVVGKT